MKQKSPVVFSVVGGSNTVVQEDMEPLPVALQTVSSFEISQCPMSPPRPCTPSPTMSPVASAARPIFISSMPVSEKLPIIKKSNGAKSILRKRNRSTGKLAQYRYCRELVDPIRDLSIATDYEMLLYSNVIMGDGTDTSFHCKHCSTTKFCCKTSAEFENTIPLVEQHLHECTSLSKKLDAAKALHRFQACPRKPYGRLVWKRLLARAIYSRVQYASKRVNFSKTLKQERIIPSRFQLPTCQERALCSS